MKSIPLPVLHIYEFECDTNLINLAYENLLSHNIKWVDNVDPSNTLNQFGYLDKEKAIPWYHEELFNWMQTCLDEVSKETIKWPVSICDSWVTKTEYKQKDGNHFHAFSVFSGVLYFTDVTSSNIVFSYINHSREKFSNLCPVTVGDGTIEITPKKGKLIIFPSDLFHFVKTHTELKNTRHSLSFNSFFSGQISNTKTAHLDIEVSGVKERYLQWKENNKD